MTQDKYKINISQPDPSQTCFLKTNPQGSVQPEDRPEANKKKPWEQLLPQEAKEGHKPAKKLCLQADRTTWLILKRVIFVNKKNLHGARVAANSSGKLGEK